MNAKAEKWVGRLVAAGNAAAILFMVCVIAGGARYTVFAGDDYTHAVRVGAFHVSLPRYLAASFRYSRELYLDWQGTYFAMFLQAFLSPLNNFGLQQLQIVMVCNALLFFAALFAVWWAASGFVWREGRKCRGRVRLTIYSLSLFAILDSQIFAEIFFWYSGAVSYSLPFSAALLALACLLLSNRRETSGQGRCIYAVLAAILLFLAAGGSLIVSGVACYAALLVTIGFYLVRRKLSAANIAVTVSGIAGALLNTAAPGNYARHAYSMSGEEWQFLQIVKWTVKGVWTETERLVRGTMFGVVLLVMLMLGVYLSKRLALYLKAYGIVSLLAVGTGYVAVFPVVLGYNGLSLPNRCYFVLDTVLVLSLCNLAVFAGCLLDRWAGLRTDRRVWAVLLTILFAAFLSAPEAISESALMTVAESVHNGAYRDYYDQCAAVYDYLEHCDEEDVVVEVPAFIENFECFYLDEDEDGWVNAGVAEYYHKRSVRRKPE